MTDIKVPEAGESITQVELAQWLVSDGDYIEKDQEVAEIDSDKATLTINADAAGILKILIDEGSTVEPGKVIGQIDTSAEKPDKPSDKDSKTEEQKADKEPKSPQEGGEEIPGDKKEDKQESTAPAGSEPKEASRERETSTPTTAGFTLSPQAARLLDEKGLDIDDMLGNPENKRITKKDLLLAIADKMHQGNNGQQQKPGAEITGSVSQAERPATREVKKVKMTTLRRKIAERLVAVKNETAMLTTFNEVDMLPVMNLRNQYKGRFEEKYGVKPGFMSFFTKAVTLSLPFFPQVNGQIEEGHIHIPEYVDIGIAVSTPKGLMVPVIRDAQSKSIFELENEIARLAKKARDNKITIEELTGGTFSITNGGVFGSMLSTPIINPPQSAILGMHNIVERPVAIKGKVEVRPVMYVALSYDHRVIDGKESVGFLVKVKEFLEHPSQMVFGGKSPEEILLGL